VPNAALRWSPPAVAASPSGGGAGLLGLIMPRGPGMGRPPATAAPNGSAKVWVLRDGLPVGVPVTVGSSDGTHTAVTGALTVSDKVIVSSRTQS
jgi:HlyD family secretion protein